MYEEEKNVSKCGEKKEAICGKRTRRDIADIEINSKSAMDRLLVAMAMKSRLTS